MNFVEENKDIRKTEILFDEQKVHDFYYYKKKANDKRLEEIATPRRGGEDLCHAHGHDRSAHGQVPAALGRGRAGEALSRATGGQEAPRRRLARIGPAAVPRGEGGQSRGLGQ